MPGRGGWSLVACLVVVIAALAWFGRRPVDSGHDGARSVLAMARAASGAPSAYAAGALALAASASHGAEEIELCGGRWFKLNPDGSGDTEAFERVIGLPEARAALMEALRADPSDYAAAVAIRLSAVGAPPNAESLDTLARMATTTIDPRVYALAFNACGAAPGSPGSCQLLSAAQWARIDPGNAAPWRAVLNDAGVRHDTATQGEALYRMSTSTRNDDRFLGLMQEVLAHLATDDASLPAALALTVDAAGVDSTQRVPSYRDLVPLCRDGALSDSNRRQTCSAVAELLFSKADTLLARQIGITLGKQLGWDPGRIEQARGESTAYFESLAAKGQDAPRGSCADMRQDLDSFKTRARLGEAGAVRDWAAQSGLAPEDFMRIEREARAQRAADAASAGSAAASAAALTPTLSPGERE
jgi:hypothetical protein